MSALKHYYCYLLISPFRCVRHGTTILREVDGRIWETLMTLADQKDMLNDLERLNLARSWSVVLTQHDTHLHPKLGLKNNKNKNKKMGKKKVNQAFYMW